MILLLFQYNAWAIPCNNVIECDNGEDEKFCDTPNWHRWVAISAILLFFITLFFTFLKYKFNLKVKKKKKKKEPDFNMIPLHCQYFSLDKEYRALLVLRLKDGGRKEAMKIYNQLHKEELHQTWHLKV